MNYVFLVVYESNQNILLLNYLDTKSIREESEYILHFFFTKNIIKLKK